MSPLPLHRFSILDSTQDELLRHPEWGYCAVMADEQTAGRGRGANRWESAPGAGLWLSARLPDPALDLGLIPQRAMAAVAEALRPWTRDLGLKWPNDLIGRVEGRLCKLGGILGEKRGGSILLGLGLNLTEAPHLPDRPFPPACLRDLAPGELPDPEVLAHAILRGWSALGSAASPSFLWPGRGEAIAWEEGEGTCLGWEPDGRLKVSCGDRILRLTSGDLRGLQPDPVA